MMKRSQTKKISAMLAAVTVLWGGVTLFSGGDDVQAVEIQGEERKAVLTKILDSLETGTTVKLSEDEKVWFIDTFSTFRYDSKVSGMALIPGGANGEDDLVLGGNDNYRYSKTKNSVVIGDNNSFASMNYMLGNNNRAIGYYGTAVGGANKVMGRNGVAIGARNTAGNFEEDRTFSNAVAIGWDNFVNGTSTGIGLKTVSTGNDAIAIGSQAVAGTERALDFFAKRIDYDQQPYYKQLQTQYPDLFGEYDDTEEGLNKVRQNIFNKYIGFFYTYGIKSLDDLTKASAASRDSILTALGWQYALTRDNVSAPVAIGKWSKALSDNSVALGAYSAVTKADMDEANSSLKDKAPFSGITLRQSGNLGSDGNANGEYLTGAISIGGPRYVQKDVNGKMQTVQEGNYVRQIKHLADGTDPTDAVNLRQLQAAVKGSGNTDNGGNTGGDTGNSAPSLSLEAGDNITIADKIGASNTKVISAPGITDIKNQVTNLNSRVDKVEDSMNTMNHRITKLDRRVDKVGAGAAALAALHPLDFDPDNKWDIAGGYGHYAGQSAMALGAYYRPNEDVMFSIGGAFGNGEDMINAGVSVKVGSGESKTTTSKAAMAKKINELQDVVAIQHQQLEEQKADMAKQEARIRELEKIVQTLAK